MKSTFTQLFALAVLLLLVPSLCFAEMKVVIVSSERAKELGMEIQSQANGLDEVRLALEFKAKGEFKAFRHVSLEIREQGKLLVGSPLQEKRSSSGSIVVRFMAHRAYLNKITLRIVAGNDSTNMVGYDLQVKDFVVAIAEDEASVPRQDVKRYAGTWILDRADKSLHTELTQAGHQIVASGQITLHEGASVTPKSEHVAGGGMPCFIDVIAQVDTQNPKTARDYYERGQIHEHAGRLDEALADYQKAGELDRQFFDAHFSRSSLCAEKKDYRGAIEALTASLKARPKAYSALFNRGLYHQYLREYDDSIAGYTLALAEDADFSHHGSSPEVCRAAAYHYRGRVYQWFKKDDMKAIADYTEALCLDPGIEMVRYRRGQAYHSIKQYSKAHTDFERAFEQRPDYPNLLNSWAWQLATCPDAKYRDGTLAVKFALKTKHLDTLAAAYAEMGQFEDAVTTQQRAIELIEREREPNNAQSIENRAKLKAKMQTRLAAYVAKRPYREE